jgi:hypothetical protein
MSTATATRETRKTRSPEQQAARKLRRLQKQLDHLRFELRFTLEYRDQLAEDIAAMKGFPNGTRDVLATIAHATAKLIEAHYPGAYAELHVHQFPRPDGKYIPDFRFPILRENFNAQCEASRCQRRAREEAAG